MADTSYSALYRENGLCIIKLCDFLFQDLKKKRDANI